MKHKPFVAPKRLIAIIATALLGVFLAILPFLPGSHFDGVRSLALIAQLIGVLGFVLVPVGLVWLALGWRKHNDKPLHAWPLLLIFVPGALLAVQLLFAAPLTNQSRDRAIANSAQIIRDIEAYKTEHGQYPPSLLALWPDYSPGVTGIERYYYEPQGESYNLVFEQPRFVLDNLGARELTVYNPRGEHQAVSHAAWRLSNPGEQGWYAVRETGTPNWKSFLFD